MNGLYRYCEFLFFQNAEPSVLITSALRIAAAKQDFLTVDTDACVGEYCAEGYTVDIFIMLCIQLFRERLSEKCAPDNPER